MKRLKFSDLLPKLILSRLKDTTWRINDKNNIVKGEELSLCYNNGEEFAKATVINTEEKRFKDLTEDDKRGHEKFSSDEEMYETYSKYYGFKVTPQTPVKVIRFKLRHI